jgi:hypothetical protein
MYQFRKWLIIIADVVRHQGLFTAVPSLDTSRLASLRSVTPKDIVKKIFVPVRHILFWEKSYVDVVDRHLRRNYVRG